MNHQEDSKKYCDQFSVDCSPPQPDQLIVISDGVLNGLPVSGVRYHSPSHMSGWWLTTREYSGDTKTLQIQHVSHILDTRPELIPFLALPCGFRFSTEPKEITFDANVAADFTAVE